MIWIIVGLLAIILVWPFLVPMPKPTDIVDEEQLADLDSHFTDINGIRVHYKEMGQGEPVFILLHGFGASAFSWRIVMEPLSNYGRVIAYDRPAFGLTERPMPGDWSATNPYSTEGNVEMLNGLMDELGVEKAVLVGNSAGGGLAAAFALAHPERVQGLALVDPAIGDGRNFNFPSWAMPLLATPHMRYLGPLLVRKISGKTGDEALRMAWHDPSKITPDVYLGYRNPLRVNNWDKALYEFSIASNPVNYRGQLSKLTMPILIVTGDDDRIVPTQSTLDLAKEIPAAKLTVFNACGHLPQEECPDQFMDSISNFILAEQ